MKSASLEQKDRVALLFREAAERGLGVVLIFEGVGITGILHTITRLSRILDPRHFTVHHFPDNAAPRDRDRAFLHKYWCDLPALGDLAVFDGAYYHDLAAGIVHDRLGKKQRRQLIDIVNDFERSLDDNGYLVIKVRIPRRRKDLEKELKKDEKHVIRRSLSKQRAKRLLKHFDDYKKALRSTAKKTDTAVAPWFVPDEGSGKEIAGAVFDYIIARMEERLSLDSRRLVADFDEAMDLLRRMRKAGASGKTKPANVPSTEVTEDA